MSGESFDSVSQWLRQLEDQDDRAAENLWARFFERLVRQAENRLRMMAQSAGDAEDIAVSVFESLCRAAQAGRLRAVENRHQLWMILLAITRQKLASHVRRETAAKRGGKRQRVPNDDGRDGRGGGLRIEDVVCSEPTAEYMVVLQDEFERLLNRLRDDRLRQIAVWKMEGYSNREIEERLNVSSATLTRKLKLIRETWSGELAQFLGGSSPR